MRRSSKVLAVMLALLVSLNAMPFGALADKGTSPVEGTVTEEWTGEDSTGDQATNETAASEEEVAPESEEPAAETPVPQPVTQEAAMAATLEAAPLAETTLTVGVNEDAEYTSLADAVMAANNGDIIVLLSDIEVGVPAIITDKHLTITSDEGHVYTISRAEKMATRNDASRGWYNPAMIEVTVSGSGTASVTLTDVVLTDAGRHTCTDADGDHGQYFAQAKNNGEDGSDNRDNRECVQDAIIAAYGIQADSSQIILGEGAVLKDYGGMSAVRATEGAGITMKSGAKICDEQVTDRKKSDQKPAPAFETGAAGAVWLQSGKFTMESGAVIEKIVGRAIYNEHGKAVIDGTIQNITNDKDIWYPSSGIAINLRDHASAELLEHANINNINASNQSVNYAGAVSMCAVGTSFSMANGSKISDVKGVAVCVDGAGPVSDTVPLDEMSLKIDGEISRVQGWSVLRLNASNNLTCTIDKNAYIHDSTLVNGAFYVQGPGIDIQLYGTVSNNNQGIRMYANYGGQSLTMYPGAKITNNGTFGVQVVRGEFIMEGGTISENRGGVHISTGGKFVMKDGEIVDNATTGVGGGVFFQSSLGWASTEYPYVDLQGGRIIRNRMNATIDKDTNTVSGGEETNVAVSTLVEGNVEKAYANINRYMQISEFVDLGDTGIYLEKYDITLSCPAKDVKFGNASDASVAGLKAQATNQGWDDMLATLWVHGDSGEVGLEMSQPAGMKESLPVYAVVLPADEEGNPVADAEAVFCGVAKENGKLQINVPGDNANGYVLGLVQPGEDYGSMTLTVPEKLDRKSSVKDIYQVPGTAVYTMSSNLRTLLQAQKPDNMTLTVEVDPKLSIDVSKVTLTSDVLEASDIKYENGVLTLTCTLKAGWEKAADMTATLNWTGTLVSWKFTEGDVLETTGAFRATVPSEPNPIEVYVPAMAAVTKMSNDVIVTAADITVYMGGEHGYEGVVSDGAIVGSNSLPEPGFYISVPEGWIENWVRFEEPATGKTWYLEPYDGAERHNVFKIVPAKDQDPLRVQFTNTAGETVVSDKFNVGDAVNQTFAMDIYHGSVGTVIAVIDYGHGQTSSTEVVTVPGTLTVRGTTANVQYGELNKEAEAGKPAVSAPEGTTFTINESNVMASADGVALLFDDIIENTQSESNRKALLEAKVNEVLKDVTVPADKVRAFEMKYLDLVDTQNGNAWVKASNSVTVSWPYPEGTDQNTDFTLLHFEDLHRDMAANDVANSIANAKVSPVKVTKTSTHIEFTTDGFSPFVLVWNTDKPAEPSEPGDNKGNGATSAAPAPTAQPAATAVIPQTGDESHPVLWVVLLAVSGSLAAVLAYKRRKEER